MTTASSFQLVSIGYQIPFSHYQGHFYPFRNQRINDDNRNSNTNTKDIFIRHQNFVSFR